MSVSKRRLTIWAVASVEESVTSGVVLAYGGFWVMFAVSVWSIVVAFV